MLQPKHRPNPKKFKKNKFEEQAIKKNLMVEAEEWFPTEEKVRKDIVKKAYALGYKTLDDIEQWRVKFKKSQKGSRRPPQIQKKMTKI